MIQVKINAVELLRKELSRLPPDIIACGDWQQPAEDRYRLSREMLGVVLELGFPLFIVERSPLVLRDVDVLSEINRRAWVSVVFSLSNIDPVLKQAFEPHSPGVMRRLQAMETFAKAGIQVGASFMPILPIIGDDDRHLDDTIRAIKDHGGSFVMGGGLTMDGAQAKRTLAVAQRLDPSLAAQWRRLYNWPEDGRPSYGPPRAYNADLGLRLREICTRHGLADRVPRHIIPGPLAVNKRIAEQLFLKTYDLELEQASDQRMWAYRKAAWIVDEWPADVAEIYAQKGEGGLRELPGIGKSISSEIAKWLTAIAAEK